MDGTVSVPNMDYGGAVAAFSTGRAGMTFNGNWELPAFQAAGIDVGAMPMPTIYDQPATFGDAHTFVLPHQDNVDEDQRDATYETVAAMLRNSLDWANGGHIPANLEVRESQEYQDLQPQANYAIAADQAVFEPFAWFTGSGSTFQAELGQALENAWLNGSDPAAAVDQLVEALNRNLATDPPM
jgi:multiple sugar transport system substrate-binding protein